MIHIKNKKGLSDIVATVLIILLAVAAVAIVWSFLRPTFGDALGKVDLQTLCFQTEVKAVSCASGVVNVQLVKGDTASIKEVMGIITYSDNSVKSLGSGTAVLAVLSTVPINVGALSGSATPVTAKAAVIVKDSSDATRTATCDETVESVACT
ncbi:MAG: hypothetical protein AABX73_02430 [Nanoarchaeota archaeon]